MNEAYPRRIAAHGVLIVTPVYWYQAPSGLKLMIDRLACVDGGNPDPTSTSGKDAAKARQIDANVARAITEAVGARRQGRLSQPGKKLKVPRPK